MKPMSTSGTSLICRISRWLGEVWRGFTTGLDRHRLLWLVLWVASMLSIADIPAGITFRIPSCLQVGYIICVGAFKGSVSLALCLLCLRWKCMRVPVYVAVGIYVALAVVNFASYRFFGFGITRRMISIVMQTNPGEAAEFVGYAGSLAASSVLSWRFALEVLFMVVAAIAVRRLPKTIFSRSVQAAGCVGIVMAASFAIVFSSGRTAHLLSLRIAKYGSETYRDLREFERLKDDLPPLPDAASAGSCHRAATVVVVIGESASRGHWQAYGYPLPTTPQVSAMADSLYIFTDVIGSSSSTSLNLENILTLSTDDMPEGSALHSPRLIDIFNKAGYSIWWLSNQERSGLVSNMSGVLVSKADVVRYVGAESSEDVLTSRYDEALLPHLRRALGDTARRKMIFVHLMGSHVLYTSRYPGSATVFTAGDVLKMPGGRSHTGDEAATIAEYDNSIRYTDSLLGEMLRAVARQPEPAVLIYFSDHGVNVYDIDGIHGRGERFVEVPALIYANAPYRVANPDMVSTLDSALTLPLTTADIAHPLMTLTGTTYSGYDPTRDFLSQKYVKRHRYVDFRPWSFEGR